jgi:SPP1 gp7 family putative phage head morphogenesis protein
VKLKQLLTLRRKTTGKGPRKKTIKLKPPKAMKRQELWYTKQLRNIVDKCWARVQEDVIPVLKALETDYAYGRATDAATGSTERINNELQGLARVFGRLQEQAERLATLQTQMVLAETDKQLVQAAQAAVSVDIAPLLTAGAVADEVALGIAANTALIKSIPEQFAARVGNTVLNNVRSGMRYEAIISDLQNDYDITKRRADLIARDQTSKLNASFNEARQTQLGITKYIWSTSLDERVRDSHAEKEGQTFRWDDPPEDTGHPGDDVNCRCTAIAVFELDTEDD